MAELKFEYVRKENKSKTFNLRMKQSTSDRLDELVAQKKIKSKGDLINRLLEDFLDNLDKETEQE